MRQLKISQQITNRESGSLDIYFQEIGKVDLISVDEEVILARRIRAGDPLALEKLTRANLRFVVSVAKQYQNKGLSLNDLINEGNLGLIRAGRRFDETRGFKFISYAVWWIRQAIMQAVAEQTRIVRLPLNRVSSLNRLSKATNLLEQDHEREPTVEELADALETSPEAVRDNLGIYAQHVSIDAPFVDGEENNLLNTLEDPQSESPDHALLHTALQTEINLALATLPARESEILNLYYGLNGQQAQTLEEIGHRFSITRERVRQIKENATRSLRQKLIKRNLKHLFF